MKIEPISAQANRSGLRVPSVPARDVPTSTGATAAGSVRGRDATSQSRSGLKAASRALREPVEVGLSLFAVGVTALLRLLRHVEEEVGVVREVLRPARPSSVALKLAFRSRSANGDSASISRHHWTV